MGTLNELNTDEVRVVIDHVARIKHDLGKYIAFQSRWLDDSASDDDCLDALKSDLLETRRGPGGTVDAMGVWAAARPALFGAEPLPGDLLIDLSDEPLVRLLDEQMEAMKEPIAVLRSGDDDAGRARHWRRQVLEISETCKNLQRAVRTLGE